MIEAYALSQTLIPTRNESGTWDFYVALGRSPFYMIRVHVLE